MLAGFVDQTLLGYYLFRLAGLILPRVPARIAYPLAALAGDLYWRFLPAYWAGVAQNLSHVLKEPATSPRVRDTARRVCRNLAYNFYDLFCVPHLSGTEVLQTVDIEGWEHIETALAGGRGIVLTAPHFGNLDIVMQVAAAHRLPMVLVAEHLQPERLYDYVTSLRSSHGTLRLIPADGALLELFRSLRRNETVALAADRDTTGSGRWTRLFGAPLRLPDSHVRLALRTGAAMVVAFSYRRPGRRFLVRILPLHLERTGSDRDVDQGMDAIMSVLEEHIRAEPEQWILTVPLWGRTSDPHKEPE